MVYVPNLNQLTRKTKKKKQTNKATKEKPKTNEIQEIPWTCSSHRPKLQVRINILI